MNPFVQFLSQFISLQENDAKLLEQALIQKQFKAGDKILEEKSICKNIVFIISGKMKSQYMKL